MGTGLKLPVEFYIRDDVVSISRELLGCFLFTSIGGIVTGGRIIETEAYRGAEDKACHAYNNRRTKRTEVMFWQGGISYVYLCYGMHNMLNIVTGGEGTPHAVLIRAIEPTAGIDLMLRRRKKEKMDKSLANGPGTVAQALGIDRSMNGVSVSGTRLWIEKGERPHKILAGPRVGVGYAGQDALLPWRFRASADLGFD